MTCTVVILCQMKTICYCNKAMTGEYNIEQLLYELYSSAVYSHAFSYVLLCIMVFPSSPQPAFTFSISAHCQKSVPTCCLQLQDIGVGG